MPPGPAPLDFESIRQRCAEQSSGAEVYRRLQKLGYEYGPAFRGVRRAWFGKDEAIFEVEWPEAVPQGAAYLAHPAVADAYLNGAPLLIGSSGTWIPTRCRETAVFQPPSCEGWSYARVTKRSAGMCSMDLMHGDATGRVSSCIGGQYRVLAQPAAGKAPRDLVYRTGWESQPVEAPPAVESGALWLIFSDRSGLGELLAAELERAGGKAILAFPGEETCAIGPGRYTVRADSDESVRAFLSSFAGFTRAVYLWGAGSAGERTEVFAAREQGCLRAIFLTQALVKLERVPHLCLVVRGACCVAPGDVPSAGAAASGAWDARSPRSTRNWASVSSIWTALPRKMPALCCEKLHRLAKRTNSRCAAALVGFRAWNVLRSPGPRVSAPTASRCGKRARSRI
jgi:phthiocerol/phenolphthiocerol synthesis type-I polyketide synthase D